MVLMQLFNDVFGADIVYEAQHTMWICGCLLSLLTCPDGANEPVFHYVILLRPAHMFEFSMVEEVWLGRITPRAYHPLERVYCVGSLQNWEGQVAHGR